VNILEMRKKLRASRFRYIETGMSWMLMSLTVFALSVVITPEASFARDWIIISIFSVVGGTVVAAATWHDDWRAKRRCQA